MKNDLVLISAFLGIIIGTTFSAFAVSIENVNAEIFSPGQEGNLMVTIENNFGDEIKDVSLQLNLENLPFTPVGSSTSTADEIEEDDDEKFGFRLKASNDANLGDYQIPYVLKYEINDQNKQIEGVFGISVRAQPDISVSADIDSPVIGEKTSIEVKIINKGLADIKFVNIKIFPEGYELLSDSFAYIGNIDSDDFETANFDVVFTKERPKLRTLIEYKDFENNLAIQNAEIPLNIYTKDEALQRGIIKRNNTLIYAFVIITALILWIIIRKIQKIRRIAKSRES